MFCRRQLVESKAVIPLLFLREILSHMAARGILTTQRSTLTSLVILCLTECSAGLECSLPDAASVTFIPRGHTYGHTAAREIWEICVTGVEDLPEEKSVIEYILAPYRRLQAQLPKHVRAEKCDFFFFFFFLVWGSGGLICCLCAPVLTHGCPTHGHN